MFLPNESCSCQYLRDLPRCPELLGGCRMSCCQAERFGPVPWERRMFWGMLMSLFERCHFGVKKLITFVTDLVGDATGSIGNDSAQRFCSKQGPRDLVIKLFFFLTRGELRVSRGGVRAATAGVLVAVATLSGVGVVIRLTPRRSRQRSRKNDGRGQSRCERSRGHG